MKDENLDNALKCIVEDVGKSYEGNYRTRLKII
ncbi:unknown [Bacteroides sp. CAG:702]|nr:unknown [Bacteroides sp. CAG:702]